MSAANGEVMENQAEAMEEAQAEDRARALFAEALRWGKGEIGSWEHGGINMDVDRFAAAQVEALIYPEPHYAICVTENAVGLYYSHRHVRILNIFNAPDVVEICWEDI